MSREVRRHYSEGESRRCKGIGRSLLRDREKKGKIGESVKIGRLTAFARHRSHRYETARVTRRKITKR
ncbi:MAG: hypothetical protein SW833_19675 [Cyanobacteriota bacterium]|nr:hypothetical protein [Cyanobacteriota bacterium]